MAAPLRETIPLQKRKIVKKSIGGVLPALIAFGVFLFWGSLFLRSMGEGFGPEAAEFMEARMTAMAALILVLIAVAGAAAPLYQYLYYRSYFYDVDDENVTIRKGVVAKKEITLPFSKITDVYVDQDVADAVFSLYDVHISTPTASSGQFAHIDGVNREGSLALKQLLLDRVNAAAG